MSPRRIAAGRAGAIRAAIALIAGSACLGAVAYAATGTGGRDVGLAGSQVAVGAPRHGASPQDSDERPPRVRLIEVPAPSSEAVDSQFRFHVPPRIRETDQPAAPAGVPGPAAPARRFQCRLDGGRWGECSSPHRLVGLALGSHDFAVRALTRRGRPGPDVTYRWQLVEVRVADGEKPVEPAEPAEGKPFSIAQTGALMPLFPGDPAQPVPLAIANPNSTAIEVTSLTVAVADAPPGCGAENFALTASGASEAMPLVVPAEGTVELSTGPISAPSIALLDLPVNQDACQGAELQLDLSGEARG